MDDKILGYRKIGKDDWQPIIHSKGYMYTAAVMTCGCCGNVISGMGGPGTQNTYCVPCYEKEKMNENIKAGADIHAGDGGYSLGTQEAYDEFVKGRNQSMGKARIKQFAEQAGITTNLDTDYFEKDINKWVDYFSEKFAELIVRECLSKIENEAAQYAEPVWAFELVNDIKEHFGVKL